MMFSMTMVYYPMSLLSLATSEVFLGLGTLSLHSGVLRAKIYIIFMKIFNILKSLGLANFPRDSELRPLSWSVGFNRGFINDLVRQE